MNIAEAVKEAIKNDRCITTKLLEGAMKIKPTNTASNCIVMFADGSYPSKYGWQPTANDLMRTDWIVVD